MRYEEEILGFWSGLGFGSGVRVTIRVMSRVRVRVRVRVRLTMGISERDVRKVRDDRVGTG